MAYKLYSEPPKFAGNPTPSPEVAAVFPCQVRRNPVEIADSKELVDAISGTYPGLKGGGVEEFEPSVLIPRLRTRRDPLGQFS